MIPIYILLSKVGLYFPSFIISLLFSKEGIKWTKWKGHWVKNGVFGIMGHKFGPFMAKFLDLNLFSPENVIFY